MPEESNRLHSPTASVAERMRARSANAGRWFGGYLVVLGVVSAAWIFLLETAFSDGLARGAAAVAWAAFIVLASWWAEGRSVYPAGATRRMWIALAVWFGSYLLVVGPLVRWQFDDSVVAWALAAAVMSLPFFIAAGQTPGRR